MVARSLLVVFLVVVAAIFGLYIDCRVSGHGVAECRAMLSPAVDRLERLSDPTNKFQKEKP
jgi:hypothetical protein